jgi:hypothetical protein
MEARNPGAKITAIRMVSNKDWASTLTH